MAREVAAGSPEDLLQLLQEVYIHEDTFRCAVKEQCIPCFYKIFPLWKSKFFPNQRPEMCPRSRNLGPSSGQGLYSYSSREKVILTVGDGDFSFSLSLSNDLRQEKSHPINLIATSYESGETVRSVYPTAVENIHLLNSRGVPVLHNVDSTKLESVPLLSQEYQHGIDIIVWNFPCKRAEFGADAQVDDIEENRELLKGFFHSAQRFIKSDHSEIHVTHKTLEPFCWWNIVDIARECGLRCEGSIVFDRYLYPGYINRKALDKKSFPFNDARVSQSFNPFSQVNLFADLCLHSTK
jgi:25S rRNA (uracil2634-N3)-methyltransferase